MTEVLTAIHYKKFYYFVVILIFFFCNIEYNEELNDFTLRIFF